MWLVRAFALAAPLTALHVGAMALVAWAVGAVVLEVRVFYGPSLSLRREHPRIRLGVVPLGGYVVCRGLGDGTDEGQGPRFADLARWRRALVFLSGNAALLLAASIALGPANALGAWCRTLPQIVALFVAPAHAAHAMRAFAAIDDPSRVVGLVAAKMAMFNLLPLAGLNGEALARLVVPARRWPRIDRAWSVLSTLAMLAIACALVAAMLRA